MAEMKISNTLVKDSGDRIIAFVKQLKDTELDWRDYHYTDEDGNTVYPFEDKEDADKFQDKLNDIFLKHYNKFEEFLNSKMDPGVIDSWKDIEEFLQSISDDETMTLMKMIEDVQTASGQLNVRLSETYPGSLEALTTSEFMDITKSYLDPETGAINIVYNFD